MKNKIKTTLHLTPNFPMSIDLLFSFHSSPSFFKRVILIRCFHMLMTTIYSLHTVIYSLLPPLNSHLKTLFPCSSLCLLNCYIKSILPCPNLSRLPVRFVRTVTASLKFSSSLAFILQFLLLLL